MAKASVPIRSSRPRVRPSKKAAKSQRNRYNGSVSVFEPIFQALNEAGARYVVVGGLATVLHGYARLTADVDLVVDLAPEEAGRVIQTLVAMGFRPQAPVDPKAFADRTTREQWVREKHMRAFSLFDPANPMRVVDLILEHVVPFEDLWAYSQEAKIHTTKIRIASIDHLITLKRQAGRPQDLADIEQLEVIRQRKETH